MDLGGSLSMIYFQKITFESMNIKLNYNSSLFLLKILCISVQLFCTILMHAQNDISITQTIRGKVIDGNSQSPIKGASVILQGSAPQMGAVTQADGSFRINDVKIGLQTLKITATGFKEITLNSISVNSGKEVTLHIEMEINSHLLLK